MANINKQHFLLAGSCAVVLSVFSRSSLGGRRQGIREVNEKENLNFRYCLVNGASAYSLVFRGQEIFRSLLASSQKSYVNLIATLTLHLSEVLRNKLPPLLVSGTTNTRLLNLK